MYGIHNFARTALLKAFESEIIDAPKKSAVSSSCSNTHNLTTKQPAPRSHKRAGAETTSRTAWTERPILPGFCFNDPPAGGGSKQFVSPETAVVILVG